MDPAFVCPLCVLGGHFVTSVFCLYALAAVPPISFRFFSHPNTASLTLSIVPCATFLAFFDPSSKISNTRFVRSEEHTSELQSHHDLVCRLLLEKNNAPGSAAPRAPASRHHDHQRGVHAAARQPAGAPARRPLARRQPARRAHRDEVRRALLLAH